MQRAVIAGDDVTGAVTFQLEAGLDTGPVFGTLTETVGPEDTAGQLLERLSHSGAVLLAQTLSAVDAGQAAAAAAAGRGFPGPQTDPRRRPARLADSRPWPSGGAPAGSPPSPAPGQPSTGSASSWSRSGCGRSATDLRPGALALNGKSVLVGTGSHAVELTRIQPAGKKMMAAADWARGMASLESVVFE